MNNTIPVYFKWTSVQPDRRQWKPSNPLLEPYDTLVVVDVPLTAEFIYNVDKLIVSQLSNDNTSTPSPMLTPTGMRYCIDQLEVAMSDVKLAEQDNPDSDDWEEIK